MLNFDNLGRPSWDLYFMSMSFLVSQRSIDPHTKHGCIVVDKDNTLLSIGYNGPPRNCIDENVPLTRPEKYDWMVHSEEAAIVNAARVGVSLKNSIFYITGYPCEKCFRKIINVGAKKIVYGSIASLCVTKEKRKVIQQMLIGQNIEMVEFKDIFSIRNIFKILDEYIVNKIKEKK